jgi:hypothetical protein
MEKILCTPVNATKAAKTAHEDWFFLKYLGSRAAVVRSTLEF